MEQGTPKARLLVVDDHAFMRVAINAILTRDSSLEVVGEAKDGQEAIERCLHTAEVAGSNPASPTRENAVLQGKRQRERKSRTYPLPSTKPVVHQRVLA